MPACHKNQHLEEITRLMTRPDIAKSSSLDWENLRRRLHAATEALSAGSTDADNEAILEERARLLSEATLDEDRTSDLLQVIVFTISGEQYAIEAKIVQGVISEPELTPVPNTPEFLMGVHNLRGEVLAVMDLRRFLNVSPGTGVAEWLIVIGAEHAEFGIMADDVSEVTALRRDSVLRPSTTNAAGGALVRGVTADAVVLIDSSALLNDTRLWVDTTSSS